MTSKEGRRPAQRSYDGCYRLWNSICTIGGQNYTAAGKTGTAEYSSDKEKDHSWFVGIANVDNPELVDQCDY